ncbi:hypothetical protein SLS64_003607 [Diaporthe eres]
MSVKPPPRWTSRSLTAMFLPHLFRKSRNAAEAIGPFTEKVPLDAHENHMFIKRKGAKMVKAIRSDFRLTYRDKPLEVPKGHVWSIATGEWVPEHMLKLHYIFPFSLGPMVAEHVSTRIRLRGSNNGMLIPPAVGQALNDTTIITTAAAMDDEMSNASSSPDMLTPRSSTQSSSPQPNLLFQPTEGTTGLRTLEAARENVAWLSGQMVWAIERVLQARVAGLRPRADDIWVINEAGALLARVVPHMEGTTGAFSLDAGKVSVAPYQGWPRHLPTGGSDDNYLAAKARRTVQQFSATVARQLESAKREKRQRLQSSREDFEDEILGSLVPRKQLLLQQLQSQSQWSWPLGVDESNPYQMSTPYQMMTEAPASTGGALALEQQYHFQQQMQPQPQWHPPLVVNGSAPYPTRTEAETSASTGGAQAAEKHRHLKQQQNLEDVAPDDDDVRGGIAIINNNNISTTTPLHPSSLKFRGGHHQYHGRARTHILEEENDATAPGRDILAARTPTMDVTRAPAPAPTTGAAGRADPPGAPVRRAIIVVAPAINVAIPALFVVVPAITPRGAEVPELRQPSVPREEPYNAYRPVDGPGGMAWPIRSLPLRPYEPETPPPFASADNAWENTEPSGPPYPPSTF